MNQSFEFCFYFFSQSNSQNRHFISCFKSSCLLSQAFPENPTLHGCIDPITKLFRFNPQRSLTWCALVVCPTAAWPWHAIDLEPTSTVWMMGQNVLEYEDILKTVPVKRSKIMQMKTVKHIEDCFIE